MSENLTAIFNPSSIAVIGASRKRGTIGGEIFHNLISKGFNGPVYPVNPTAKTVQSTHAYKNLAEVPEAIDLAVIVVPKKYVLNAVKECREKKVKAIIIISAGFGEIGAAGKKAQDEITKIVRDSGMRMVGPNCLGVLNTDPKISMDATFAPTWPPPGRVSFSSQSGALGQTILDHAKVVGIGVRHFISVGNKADVSGNDLVEFWENDDATDVILLYLESFGNPRKFIPLAKRVARKKPILAVKSGRTKSGRRAASSHTGALAGADSAVDALLLQTGIIRADTVEELFDLALLLANQPEPKGDRVAILTNAGGPGIMGADALESRGLKLPALDDATLEKLGEFLPAEASLRNPVDMIASATAESYGKAVTLLLDDPNIDSLLVIFVPPLITDAPEVAKAIREGLDNSKNTATKTVLACFMGTRGLPESLKTLQAGNVPSYNFPESAALALSKAVAYGRWKAQPEGEVEKFSVDKKRAQDEVRDAISNHCKNNESCWLSSQSIAVILKAYGITTPKMGVAVSVDEAANIAADIGFPVALKLESKTISHKSEIGGVHLNLKDKESVRSAWLSIEASLKKLNKKDEMDGAMIQEMAPDGLEVIVGASYDESFGHLLMYGLGGVHVEVLKDVAWGVTPLSNVDANNMLDGVKGSRLLEGFRGSPKADRLALCELLQRLSQLVCDLVEIEEMDLNPVRILEDGKGIVCVDARIKINPR